jgi:DNA-binding HxlR family transcriptional regulator
MEPIAHLIGLIGEKWMLPIISLLFMDKLRFNTMKKHLSITSRTLSRKLRKLESKGIVERMIDETGSSVYRLTDAGKSIYQSLSTLVH